MLQTDARSRLRIDLADTDEELLQDDDLNRSIQKAVSDLSRFLPLDAVLEVTLDFGITGEAWTSAAAAGTYVSLKNKPIENASETVKNESAVACTRDTDYYIDYTSGKITHISGGKIGNGKNCTISYNKSKIGVDISSITSNLLRIERVEYPVGDIPQSFVSNEVRGDILVLTGGVAEAQSALTEGKHVAIYYKTGHTPPTDDEEGSYPKFLDDTVLLAASAYALFTAAVQINLDAKADLASALAILAAISKTDAETALGKITTEVAAGDTALGLVSTESAAAKAYLTTGTPYINAKNYGADVPQAYGTFASVQANVAGYYRDVVLARVQRAQAYIAEAQFRVEAQNLIRAQAESYLSEATQKMAIAERLRTEGIERRNEAWSIWRDPKQYIGDFTMTLLRQPGTYSK